MSDDPKAFNAPASTFLSAADVDNVGRAVLTLAMELSVMNDRLIAIEDFLIAIEDFAASNLGKETAARLAKYQPSDAAKKRMAEERKRVIGALIETLAQD